MRWAFDRIWDALSGLRDVIGTFTGWCSQMMSDWGTKYIIGPFAFALFWTLYDLGWQFRWKVIDLRDELESVGDFLEGIEDGWKLDDLIGGLWSGWGSFTRDARGFILDRVFPIGTELYWFSVDPIAYVDLWIDTKWPDLKHIAWNPAQYVLDRVFPIGTDWYWFRVNPGDMIELWLTDRVPGLADFLAGPRDWLQAGVSDAMGEVQAWITSRMLHILQAVIEKAWEGGEAD